VVGDSRSDMAVHMVSSVHGIVIEVS
jgi:hypothetical protein